MPCVDTEWLTGSVLQFLHLLNENKECLPPGVIAMAKSAASALGPLGISFGRGMDGVAAISPLVKTLTLGREGLTMSKLMSNDRGLSNIIQRVALMCKEREKKPRKRSPEL